MQLTNAPLPSKFQAIEAAIAGRCIDRYMGAAKGDRNLAWRLYVWNGDLCEAFYLPLHVAEIVSRNAIQEALIARRGAGWCTDLTFMRLLDPRFQDELKRAVSQEKAQHGLAMTDHHVVSALTFGFWEHLLTKRFVRFMWPGNALQTHFPQIGNRSLEDLRSRVETIRRWRNRVAHHRAIYDRNPHAKFQQAEQLIRWVSIDTADWVLSEARVSQVLTARPK